VQALLAARGDLVVAPETSIPYLPQQMPEGLWEGLQARFAQGHTAALVGVPLGDDQVGYTNSAAGFAPGQPMYRYDKQHLVPFGEFIPTGFRWFTRMMDIPLGDFKGTRRCRRSGSRSLHPRRRRPCRALHGALR
jgi:apolipoprotein N-acyltransferase